MPRRRRTRAPLRHARGVRAGHPLLRAVSLVVVAAVAFVTVGAVATYAKLQGNVERVDIRALVDEHPTTRPTSAATPGDPTSAPDPDAGQPVNILVIGSDTREGANDLGGEACNCSDTTIVVHISADRSRVELVSIPRDSLVEIPSCVMTDGSTSPVQHAEMFNKAFSTGWQYGGDIASATACTWRTVEANTGVDLTHFVVVDFSGFRSMVDSIGGVTMCIPRDLYSKDSKLDIQAGVRTLDGPTALAFARTRTAKGMSGSDLERIGNQQRLLQAMVTAVLSKSVLTDFPELLAFLSATTSSLTVDSELSVMDLAGLAYSLRGIGPSDTTFMTIPVAAAPQNKYRVVWTSAATKVWGRMVADTPVTGDVAPPPPATPGATRAPVPAETKRAGQEAFTANDVTAVCS